MASPILNKLPRSPLSPRSSMVRSLTANLSPRSSDTPPLSPVPSSSYGRHLSPQSALFPPTPYRNGNGNGVEKTQSPTFFLAPFQGTRTGPKTPISAHAKLVSTSFTPTFAALTTKKDSSPLNGREETVCRRPFLPKSSYSCTPLADKRDTPDSAFIPNSPAIALEFSATRNCQALVHSPFRADDYVMQRRRLYHQDSPPPPFCVSPPDDDEDECVAELQTSFNSFGLKDSKESAARKNSLSVLMRKDSAGSVPGSAGMTPKLGKGGFGSVFIGKYDGQRVAIKQLYNQKLKDGVKEASFCGELNLFRLDHSNIVRIITFTSCGSTTQVVFEYVGPKNLQQIADDTENEPLPFVRRHRYLTELADALGYCHSQRLVHLDVKTTNILVTEHNDHLKLADFGCSRFLPPDVDCLAVTPSCLSNAGTLIYKAPELLKGLPATAKADVYSYAYVIWELLARKLPFEGQHAHTTVFLVVSRELRPDCSDQAFTASSSSSGNGLTEEDGRLLALAQTCWKSDPESRPDFATILKKLKKMKNVS